MLAKQRCEWFKPLDKFARWRQSASHNSLLHLLPNNTTSHSTSGKNYVIASDRTSAAPVPSWPAPLQLLLFSSSSSISVQSAHGACDLSPHLSFPFSQVPVVVIYCGILPPPHLFAHIHPSLPITLPRFVIPLAATLVAFVPALKELRWALPVTQLSSSFPSHQDLPQPSHLTSLQKRLESVLEGLNSTVVRLSDSNNPSPSRNDVVEQGPSCCPFRRDDHWVSSSSSLPDQLMTKT